MQWTQYVISLSLMGLCLAGVAHGGEYQIVYSGVRDIVKVNGLSEAGIVVGSGSGTSANETPMIFLPTWQELPHMIGSAYGAAGAEIVGEVFALADFRAFTWNAQAGMRRLGSLGDGTLASGALGINLAGTTVGWSYNAAHIPRPVVWLHGQIMELGTLGGAGGSADAINTYGDIVGGSQTPDGHRHATLWAVDGQITDLTPGLTTSSAAAISDTGIIVGDAVFTAGGASTAFRWTQAHGLVNLGMLTGDTASYATGVDTDGIIVGTSWSTTSGHAVRWRHSVIEALTPLLGDPAWTLQGVIASNATGQIAGIGLHHEPDGYPPDVLRVFLLTPIALTVPPPPVTLVVLVRGDFNGDGYEDQAGLDAHYQIWRCFAGQQWEQLPGYLWQLVAGDLDGDGKDDLAGLGGAHGTDVFLMTDGQHWEWSPGSWQGSLIIGDFAGVGHQQLAGIGWMWQIHYAPDIQALRQGHWQALHAHLLWVGAWPDSALGHDVMAGIGGSASLWYAGTLDQWVRVR
jgi:probable HAF family extracellular repeat protein